MSAKRLVLMVEGHGDVDGVTPIVKRLLTEQDAWGALILDPNPIRVGGVHELTGARQQDWLRYLQVAGKRPNTGAVLLVLDGDAEFVQKQPFCASSIAKSLVEAARNIGAGTKFTLAVVFACMEFESWLIAGIESLAMHPNSGVRSGTKLDLPSPETAPRMQKGGCEV